VRLADCEVVVTDPSRAEENLRELHRLADVWWFCEPVTRWLSGALSSQMLATR
jgi:hypothetical protein